MTQEIHIHRRGEQIGPYSQNQVQEMIRTGMLDKDESYWMEGMNQWAPILSLLENQATIPPPAPPLPNTLDTSKITPPVLTAKAEEQTSLPKPPGKTFLKILAGFGLFLGYVIVALAYFSITIGQGVIPYSPLIGTFVGIALFRRLTRKRSEAMVIKHPSSKWFVHYVKSYFSAGWRWLLFFLAIALLAAIPQENFEQVGWVAGIAAGMMIITMIFAADVPFRTLLRLRRQPLANGIVELKRLPNTEGIFWDWQILVALLVGALVAVLILIILIENFY